MQGFGLQNAFKVKDREFRVHTGCDPNKQKISCEVFEDGRYIYSFSDSYNIRDNENGSAERPYVQEVTSNLHLEIMDEVAVLFRAFEKLKTIKDSQPHYRLGKLLLQRNFYPEAIVCFEQAIKLKPDHIRAQQRLAVSYLEIKNFNKARSITDTLLSQNEFPDILVLSGIINSQVGFYDNASKELQKAISMKPDYLESQFNMGIILFLSTLDDGDENIVIPVRIMRALKQIRENEFYEGEQWQNRFDSLERILKNGKREEIIEALFQFQIYLLTKDDSTSSAMDYFLIKFMYGGQEINQDEIDVYEQKIRLNADKNEKYADYWNEMGSLHLIQCREYFLNAITQFDNAVTINPRYEEANNNLSMLKRNKQGFLILLRAILK